MGGSTSYGVRYTSCSWEFWNEEVKNDGISMLMLKVKLFCCTMMVKWQNNLFLHKWTVLPQLFSLCCWLFSPIYEGYLFWYFSSPWRTAHIRYAFELAEIKARQLSFFFFFFVFLYIMCQHFNKTIDSPLSFGFKGSA